MSLGSYRAGQDSNPPHVHIELVRQLGDALVSLTGPDVLRTVAVKLNARQVNVCVQEGGCDQRRRPDTSKRW